MGSILASYDTMESEERKIRQCWIKYLKINSIKLVKNFAHCVYVFTNLLQSKKLHVPKVQTLINCMIYMYKFVDRKEVGGIWGATVSFYT